MEHASSKTGRRGRSGNGERPELRVPTGAAWAPPSASLRGQGRAWGLTTVSHAKLHYSQASSFPPPGPESSCCPGLRLPSPVPLTALCPSLPPRARGPSGFCLVPRVGRGAAWGALPGPVTGCPAHAGGGERGGAKAVRGLLSGQQERGHRVHCAAQLGVPSSPVNAKQLRGLTFLACELLASETVSVCAATCSGSSDWGSLAVPPAPPERA